MVLRNAILDRLVAEKYLLFRILVRFSRQNGRAFHGKTATRFAHRGHLFQNLWPVVNQADMAPVCTAYSGV
jgi:hypothetical protein